MASADVRSDSVAAERHISSTVHARSHECEGKRQQNELQAPLISDCARSRATRRSECQSRRLQLCAHPATQLAAQTASVGKRAHCFSSTARLLSSASAASDLLLADTPAQSASRFDSHLLANQSQQLSDRCISLSMAVVGAVALDCTECSSVRQEMVASTSSRQLTLSSTASRLPRRLFAHAESVSRDAELLRMFTGHSATRTRLESRGIRLSSLHAAAGSDAVSRLMRAPVNESDVTGVKSSRTRDTRGAAYSKCK